MVALLRPRDKTYADYEALPEGIKAELIDGDLFLLPQPMGRHIRVSSLLGALVGSRIGLTSHSGPSGPGGWWILDKPECHLRPDLRVVIPDLAGWRRARMQAPPPDTHKFTLIPDWVCEVLSPSTAGRDTIIKMPLYLQAGVAWAWIVDPPAQRIDVYKAGDGEWLPAGALEGPGVVKLPPFDEVELDLSPLWLDL